MALHRPGVQAQFLEGASTDLIARPRDERHLVYAQDWKE